ncbi:GntR family transcriptional regulator [Rubrivivax sp. A210]|uniref:FadR/GntR family transcriptional regulator n=1 Tax=Rubrivivax sp. A210 TaxID=2772301 RepID=UPI00191987E3|nr:FadR/GntR family transcriptional regulator [Rubrivivax sp. A210]CAD5373825.1 GntR family transcriptional regulator [Rubrivivax sp. A210]
MTARNVLGQTLDRLGEAIVDGRYPAGLAIPPEPLLGGELGVSRTVVREAVKSLAAKGLLVTGPKLGTRVLPEAHWNWFDADVVRWKSRKGLSREFLRDLQELRRVVEPAGARLAAERATPADLAEIEAAWDGMRQAITQGGDYVAHDLRFHQGLLRASHNRMLVQMGQALGALLRTSFEISTRRADAPASSLPLHRAVLDAVRAGKPAAAERACLVLIAGAQADIEAVLASPRRRLPSLQAPAARLKARPKARIERA